MFYLFKKYYLYLLIFLFLLSLFFVYLKNNSHTNSFIDFLNKNQNNSGMFVSRYCPDLTSDVDCREDKSVFVTSLITSSLIDINNSIKNKELNKIIDKSFSFINKEKRSNDTWNFWSTYNDIQISSDLDDTSINSLILYKYKKIKLDNLDSFSENKFENGSYYTWFNDGKNNKDVDLVVISNTINYLSKYINVDDSCSYIKNNLNKDIFSYYLDKYYLYYSLSKAYNDGVSCLGDLRGYILDNVIKDVKINPTFNNNRFKSSLALNILINFNYKDNDSYLNNIYKYLSKNDYLNTDFTSFFWGVYKMKKYYWSSDVYTKVLIFEALIKYNNFIKL